MDTLVGDFRSVAEWCKNQYFSLYLNIVRVFSCYYLNWQPNTRKILMPNSSLLPISDFFLTVCLYEPLKVTHIWCLPFLKLYLRLKQPACVGVIWLPVTKSNLLRACWTDQIVDARTTCVHSQESGKIKMKSQCWTTWVNNILQWMQVASSFRPDRGQL